jgi:hypothetical protein
VETAKIVLVAKNCLIWIIFLVTLFC